MTMIFLKLIFETSGAIHVSSTDVELQAVKPRSDAATKAAAAKRMMEFVFKRVRQTELTTNDVVALNASSGGCQQTDYAADRRRAMGCFPAGRARRARDPH